MAGGMGSVKCVVMAMALLASGCEPPPPELPTEPRAMGPSGQQGPGVSTECPLPAGSYSAAFRLVGTEGSCGDAKAESYDPLAFDAEGRFLSPVGDSLARCETLQVGCLLAVRCTSHAFSSRAALDAELTPDAARFTGLATVTGSYAGCREVRYSVDAVRLPAK